MNFLKKISIFSLLLVALPSGEVFSAETTPSKKLVDKIAVVVNQDIILFSEYESFRKKMEEAVSKGSEKDLLNKKDVFDKKVLQQMIEDKLIQQEIKLQGLETSDTQLENVVDEVMKNNGLKNKKELERALKGEGLTYEEFVADYKNRIGKSNLVNQIIRPKIKVSNDEIESEYKKRMSSDEKQLLYQMAMIFISKDHTSAQSMEKMKKSIASLSDFSKIANEKTEGPGLGKGGELGWIEASDLQSPLNEAVSKMKKGIISKVIQDEKGYYILACLDSKSKFSEQEGKIKESILDDLMNVQLSKNLDQYIQDLKRKANIETFL